MLGFGSKEKICHSKRTADTNYLLCLYYR